MNQKVNIALPSNIELYIKREDLLHPYISGNKFRKLKYNIQKALEEPLKQIVNNAGLDGSVVLQKVKEGKGDFGYNARNEQYEDLFAAGVIDPTKVSRVALENASSIAGMLLTTECVISDKVEDAPAGPPMGGMPGGMGGMGGMM